MKKNREIQVGDIVWDCVDYNDAGTVVFIESDSHSSAWRIHVKWFKWASTTQERISDLEVLCWV